MVQNVGQLERRRRGKTTVDHVGNVDIIMERGTHVPDGRIPQREEVEMGWT